MGGGGVGGKWIRKTLSQKTQQKTQTLNKVTRMCMV
jgi:hypothetical protein